MSDTILLHAGYEKDLETAALNPPSGVPYVITEEFFEYVRSTNDTPIEEVIGRRPIEHREVVVPATAGRPQIVLSVFTPRRRLAVAPGFYHIHGGGMWAGNRFWGIETVLEWVELFGVVCASVDYRLTPEHPDPVPSEDCYAGWVWFSDHADEFGVDPDRIMIGGSSAGGGLSAAVALMARDRGGPRPCAQLLMCPMIDDSMSTVSTRQFMTEGRWSGGTNEVAWRALLQERYGTDDVSPYAAPARAADLSNLPAAFIDVGAAEIFRDEATQYALRLWAAATPAELHVWEGAFHCFDAAVPTASISRTARDTRTDWVRRHLLG